MSPALTRPFRRLLDEMAQPESVEWDTRESLPDTAHYHAAVFLEINGGVFGAEDLHIAGQRRLGRRAGVNDTSVLGRFEQPLRRFHDNLDAALRDRG